MVSSKDLYEVEYTKKCIEEMRDIYEYISKRLKNSDAAIKLITKVNEMILNLKNSPELYMKINKFDKLKREYHRMVVKKYIILYTIDYENKKVYISHMFYEKRNYLV